MKTIACSCISLLLLSFILWSCKTKTESDEKNKTQLCERIQYDVFIKSPDSNSIERGWWDQNIEGSKREAFIKKFLQLAQDGKVKAYNYDNELMTPDQVKKIDAETDTAQMPDPSDPNKMRTTVIKHELDMQSIIKVRFLEEWYLDEKKMVFDKKVVGMMLMSAKYDEEIKLRGYKPLFWIYFDDSYPAKLKL